MSIIVQKNKEYIVDIIDNGFEGEGIAKIDNFTVFIPGVIKGERVKILIVKVLSSHAFGKVIEGLEIVDKIARVRTDFSDRPMVKQVIQSMTVETFGVEYPEPEKM